MSRSLSPEYAPVLRAFAKAYRAQAGIESDPDEMRALIRLAERTENKARVLEKLGPYLLQDVETDDPTLLNAMNERLRGEAAAANIMLHIVLECLGSDFIGIDRITYDLMWARDHAKVSPEGTLPSEAAVKGYTDKLEELLSRILDR